MNRKLKIYLRKKILGERYYSELQKLIGMSTKVSEEIKNGNRIYKNVYIHKGAILEAPVTLYANADIRDGTKIGRYSYINNGTTVFYGTSIGRFCSIGKKCEIGTVDHPLDWLSSSSIQYNINGHFGEHENFMQYAYNQTEGCTIGNDVWVGSLSVIKSGVSIGHGAVVGANSMVVKDVPPYAIVGGVPARVLGYRFEKEIIQRLLALKWWELSMQELNGIPFNNILAAIQEIERKRFETERR